MNHSVIDTVFTGLIKQLVYFDENITLLLNKYAPYPDRERKEMEQQLVQYKDRLELIVRDFDVNILHSVALIGSKVTVWDAFDHSEQAYTIVLPEYSDMDQNYISFLSPIGSSLLLANHDETVTVLTPSGSYDLTIRKIEYEVYES